jgi:hypothetical protein
MLGSVTAFASKAKNLRKNWREFNSLPPKERCAIVDNVSSCSRFAESNPWQTQSRL